MFHFTSVAHFLYPFKHPWAFRFFGILGYCEKYCKAHENSTISEILFLILLEKHTEVRLLDHVFISIFSFFFEASTYCFPQQLCQFCHSTNILPVFQFLHTLVNTCQFINSSNALTVTAAFVLYSKNNGATKEHTQRFLESCCSAMAGIYAHQAVSTPYWLLNSY